MKKLECCETGTQGTLYFGQRNPQHTSTLFLQVFLVTHFSQGSGNSNVKILEKLHKDFHETGNLRSVLIVQLFSIANNYMIRHLTGSLEGNSKISFMIQSILFPSKRGPIHHNFITFSHRKHKIEKR